MKETKNPRDEKGRLHGYWEVYYDNGNLHYKGLYIHGNRYGYWEQYSHSGVIIYRGNFIKEKRYGYFIEYNFSYRIGCESLYYDDEKIYITLNKKLIK